ncbi:poly polymerase, putative [Ichthyophthirius multifiliis]|uniref:polynucleotide adenylyltransferase n=1 Tax=Ichthyophthirius multifiliis TaxID=5932 RepID=G0R3W5_ICHMU|nr:poly polymerase, putative [Ichthyophthirius multifiliis]EGR27841.1 poly polymerase, putative [Ichthyophthirius multifiliis]|eukprot:XP_004027186.1 poly polymerase, putative [Ichthyophthirius multifiliis]
MDQKDIKSINGFRSNQAILEYVSEKNPNPEIAKSRFKDALKVIKIWARHNGIYDNRLGFLSGISLAIMLAKILQLFPNLEVNGIIKQFFQTFASRWDWKKMDVQLGSRSEEMKVQMQSQQRKCMHIITPAYPEYNTTDRVKMINFNIIVAKLIASNDYIQNQKNIVWEKIVEKENFINHYKLFIEIDLIQNKKGEIGQFIAQKKYFALRLLNLFDQLKGIEYDPEKIEVRPWPIFFDKKDPDYPYCAAFLIGLKNKMHQPVQYSLQEWIVGFAKQLINNQKYQKKKIKTQEEKDKKDEEDNLDDFL